MYTPRLSLSALYVTHIRAATRSSSSAGIQYVVDRGDADPVQNLLPLLIWVVAFSALAVSDRALLMSLITTNYLAELVVSFRSTVGGLRFAHYEQIMVRRAKQLPRWYFFGVVIPVILWVTYSILRVMLEQATVEAGNTDYDCDVLGRERFYYLDNHLSSSKSYKARCEHDASNVRTYAVAVLATVPMVQLFTPVLAAILLMLLVIQVHALELDAALDQLRNVATAPTDDLESENADADQSTDRTVEAGLAPFIKVQASLLATSKRWSSIMATEVVLVALLICEPLVVNDSVGASSSGTNTSYQLLSNSMHAVAVPFIFLLALGAAAITWLNDKISAVPFTLTREQLFTPSETDVFCSNYDRLQLGLAVFGLRLTKARIAIAFSSLFASVIARRLASAQGNDA